MPNHIWVVERKVNNRYVQTPFYSQTEEDATRLALLWLKTGTEFRVRKYVAERAKK